MGDDLRAGWINFIFGSAFYPGGDTVGSWHLDKIKEGSAGMNYRFTFQFELPFQIYMIISA